MTTYAESYAELVMKRNNEPKWRFYRRMKATAPRFAKAVLTAIYQGADMEGDELVLRDGPSSVRFGFDKGEKSVLDSEPSETSPSTH